MTATASETKELHHNRNSKRDRLRDATRVTVGIPTTGLGSDAAASMAQHQASEGQVTNDYSERENGRTEEKRQRKGGRGGGGGGTD